MVASVLHDNIPLTIILPPEELSFGKRGPRICAVCAVFESCHLHDGAVNEIHRNRRLFFPVLKSPIPSFLHPQPHFPIILWHQSHSHCHSHSHSHSQSQSLDGLLLVKPILSKVHLLGIRDKLCDAPSLISAVICPAVAAVYAAYSPLTFLVHDHFSTRVVVIAWTFFFNCHTLSTRSTVMWVNHERGVILVLPTPGLLAPTTIPCWKSLKSFLLLIIYCYFHANYVGRNWAFLI